MCVEDLTSVRCYGSIKELLRETTEDFKEISSVHKRSRIRRNELNPSPARTVTATMCNGQKSSQGSYYTYEYIYGTGDLRDNQRIRGLTASEALRLQGFTYEDYERLTKETNLSPSGMMRLAGNAVSINVVYGILSYLIGMKIIS